jgi:starvation-inducible DNA-binding protein
MRILDSKDYLYYYKIVIITIQEDQMKLELMQKVLSDIAVLNVKLHNIHWNVVGPHFMAVHEYTEKLYTGFFEDYDELAERIKMLGGFPLASMEEYLKKTSIRELPSKKLSEQEALTVVYEDLETLRSQYAALREAANTEGDFITVALAEAEVGELDKELWLIRSMTVS